MPLLPFSRCDVPAPEGVCDFLFATAEQLLAVAAAGLEPFLPPSGCGDSFDTYVSMNPPIAEWYDALSIHLVTFGTAPSRSAVPEFGVWPQQQAKWDMRLWENCYPAPTKESPYPSPATYNAINAHVYAHGTAIHQALMVAKVRDALGLPATVAECVIGDLTPLGGPAGDAGAVGWKVDITTRFS